MKNLLTLILALSFAACSSTKANISPNFKAESVRSLAILPVEYPAQVQREKVDSLRNAVESELKNNGYEVLADRLVRQICTTPVCPERDMLASKYLVDGLVKVEIRSVQRANFLAGFVNTISGKITIKDLNFNDLVTVDQTENERGGLVFNSGQVVQGLISTAENTEEASFNRLSSRFAQSLISKIPKTSSPQVNKDAIAVSIGEVGVKQIKPQIFQVCAKATPNALVSVLVNRSRSNLREISQANYCGTFLLDSSLASNAVLRLEARSPFGDAVRKEVSLGNEVKVCNLEGRVIITENKGKKKLELTCIQLDKKGVPVVGTCNTSESCPATKFIVFRAPSSVGPYQKVTEIQSTSWIDEKPLAGNGTRYELISVNKAGVWSLPYSPKPVS